MSEAKRYRVALWCIRVAHVESAGARFRLQPLAKAAAKTDLTYMLKISASL